MEKDNTKYILELSADQAKLLSCACEFYSRIRMGQWQELLYCCSDLTNVDYCKIRDEIEPTILEARSKVYPELSKSYGHSYGVGKFKDADMIWEIYEVLRNKIAWHEHPEGGWTVDFNRPISFSGEPLAKCDIKEDK